MFACAETNRKLSYKIDSVARLRHTLCSRRSTTRKRLARPKVRMKQASGEAEPDEGWGMQRRPGTPSLLRELNDRSALELLLTGGPMTRSQLGEHTGLSKVTASQLLARLEERGIVAVAGEQAGGRGPEPAPDGGGASAPHRGGAPARRGGGRAAGPGVHHPPGT